MRFDALIGSEIPFGTTLLIGSGGSQVNVFVNFSTSGGGSEGGGTWLINVPVTQWIITGDGNLDLIRVIKKMANQKPIKTIV